MIFQTQYYSKILSTKTDRSTESNRERVRQRRPIVENQMTLYYYRAM